VTSPVRPFGDRAFLVSVADVGSARALARAVDQAQRAGTAPAGTIGVLTGLDSIVVRVGPGAAGDDVFRAWLADLASRPADVPANGAGTGRRPERDGAGRTVSIPVDFDGPDLPAVADAIGATPSAVVDLLIATDLEVALLGFAPGFPYLVGLPPALAAVPRRTTPRPMVPAGSVAVGGGFASVYPQSSPGGWMVLGHTGTQLFDPRHPPYALLQPGDTVRFSVAGTGSGDGMAGSDAAAPGFGRARPPLTARGDRAIEVLEPGLLSLVEDAGRRGMAGLGVPEAGPADPESMDLANRLVGNAAGAAGLEITARGPTLRFGHEAHLAVVASAPDGVDVHLDGHPVGADLVVPVRPGQTLTVGRVRHGLRAYVALAGGIETPLVVGSRSSDQLSGLGPGPLVAGDLLDLGRPARPHGLLSRPPLGAVGPSGPVRVVPGPHPFPAAATDALSTTEWSVAADSNRIGLRLEGGTPLAAGPPVTSTAMVTGAVQVPPDGNPIVLMVDHATLGGYPVIACVISADLARLGQLRPGDRLVFSPVSQVEARRASEQRARALAASVSGWFPTAAAT
jgi:KipI family sensor histidine kinase inhibitor